MSGDGFRLAERTLQLLDSKYLTSLVSYQGLYRQERLPYPPDAIREALLNAIMHKDYFGGPIFVWVYDDRLVFFNEGSLIEGLTLDDLQQPHFIGVTLPWRWLCFGAVWWKPGVVVH